MLLAVPPALPPNVTPAVAADHAFAATLYKAARPPTGNLFLSPASIRVALAMTAAGAAGDTAIEMQKVLGLDPDSGRSDASFAALIADWNARGTPSVPLFASAAERERIAHNSIELHLANRLWGQTGYTFLDPFLITLKKSYLAPLKQLDFASRLQASVDEINAWVAKQTAEKIKELIPQGVLATTTKLVLTNAIYFKSAWRTPFSAAATHDAPFSTGVKQVNVPTMQETAHWGYGELPGLKLLELPYIDGTLSMVVVLPNEQSGLATLESSLSGEAIDSWFNALQPAQRVWVQIPRFKVEGSFSLAKPLRAMGMNSAFSEGTADFSHMDGKRDLVIADVLHKAFVEVTESGTEAAAATAVVMRALTATLPPHEAKPFEFKADHPFLFFIRDIKNNSILFAGRVVDPG